MLDAISLCDSNPRVAIKCLLLYRDVAINKKYKRAAASLVRSCNSGSAASSLRLHVCASLSDDRWSWLELAAGPDGRVPSAAGPPSEELPPCVVRRYFNLFGINQQARQKYHSIRINSFAQKLGMFGGGSCFYNSRASSPS